MASKEELHSVYLTEQIAQITQHLHLLDISFFQFVRVYKDGSITTVSNQGNWLELFLRERLYTKGFFSTNVFNLADGSYLWQSVPRGDVCAIAKTSFHIDHGLSILRKHEHYANIYLFAADDDNYYINNLYLNSLQLFNHFVNYFDASTNSILDDKLIRISTGNDLSYYCDVIDKIPENKQELFVKNISKKAFIYNYNGHDVKLTQRQFDCVNLMLKGYSTKAIATQLDLSPRTCGHYIEAVQDKFDCRTRSHLVNLLNLIQIKPL